MAFFDELKKGLSVTGQTVAQKTKEISETVQLKAQLNSEKDAITKAYAAIGKQVFEAAEADEAEKYAAEFEAIRESLEKIAELEARHKQEIDALLRDHRTEREEWHVQRKNMHEENANLRVSFDKAVSFRDAQLRRQYIEKTILFALFIASVVVLILK